MLREPVVSGAFYPDDRVLLRSQLDSFFLEPKKYVDNVQGLIVPHAGYIYSGKIAAYGYSQLMDSSFDLVIILAPSHHHYSNNISLYSAGNYKTPFGEVKVDLETIKLMQGLDSKLSFVPEMHKQEHSLEVQLPFLQYLFKDSLMILPIVMSGQPENADILSKAIANIAKQKKILIIASSDMSHYHDYYSANEMDQKTLDAIQKGQTDIIISKCVAREWELCGLLPVITLLKVANDFGWHKVDILHYANSGDTSGIKNRVVGYGAVSFSS